MRRRVWRLGAGLGVVGALLLMLLGVAPALAGVALAVVPDLPTPLKVGQMGLAGSLTIVNANSAPDDEDSNIVFDITLTPACGSDAASATCPDGAEEPEVFAIDSPATGRHGTACAGTVFTVTVADGETGEVMFAPRAGIITLGPATGPVSGRQCTIDFTFSVRNLPMRDPVAGRERNETTAHTGAYAVSASGQGVGANWSTREVEY